MSNEAILVFDDGTRFALPESGATIGRRADCGLVLTDPETSRRHANVFYREGSLYVADLDSMNGTFVNGVRLAAEQVLADGDVIQLGDTRLTTQITPQAPAGVDATDLEAPIASESAVISLHEPAPDSDEVVAQGTAARLVVHASEPEPGPGGASVEIALSGVLDIETADQFREVAGRLVESGVARFSLILDGVSYLDSSGLGALVALQREAKTRSGAVELRGLQPAVRGVIELTRLDRVFSIRD